MENTNNEIDNAANKVLKETAEVGVDVAVGVATGNWMPLIIKIAGFFFMVIMILIIVATCLFEIIFNELGFSDANEYTETMYEVETQNIDEGISAIYGKSKNSTIDSKLNAQMEEQKSKIKEEFESKKKEAQKETKVETEEDKYYTTHYENCKIDDSCFAGFWSDKKYVKYFSPMIQNYGTDELIHWVENKKSGKSDEIASFLTSQIENQDFFSYEELEDTVKVKKEEKKVGKNYYYEYTGKDETVKEKKVYEKDLTDDMKKLIKDNPNEWKHSFEYEIKEVEITYVTKHYKINMIEPESRIELIGGYEYKKIGDGVTDEENEEDMQTAIDMLESIEKGDFGEIIKISIKEGASKVKEFFEEHLKPFQKKYSYRKIVKNVNTVGVAGYAVTSSEDSIYVYLRDLGYSHAGACGIMGNMKQENSTFNPTLVDKNGYYGCFCIKDNRLKYFKETFCKMQGLEPDTVKAQLDYISVDAVKFRGQTNGNALLKVLYNTDDVKLAAVEFCVGYEGCIRPVGKQKKDDLMYTGSIFCRGEQNYYGRYFQEMGKRVAYAQAYDSKYGKYALDYSDLKNNSSIVDYALKFVGNKYIYGGDSLEHGIDCSHFVWRVLLNTGYYKGEYAQSTKWANKGTKVNSLKEALPGDIIVWNGHIAIYMGDNTYVHASNSKPYPAGGIKVSTLSNSSKHNKNNIIGIRRFYPVSQDKKK